jgi:hypothetical protein
MLAMRSPEPRRSLVAFAAISLACATVPPVQVGESVDRLRTAQGVCAGTTYVNPEGHRVRLKGCLRTGSAGTIFDNLEARLVTELQTDDPDDADLTHWQVQLLRDGEQVLHRALDAGPSHRRCAVFGLGCRERVADVATIAEGLGYGTYTIRYRLMSAEAYAAGRQPAELTVVLQ